MDKKRWHVVSPSQYPLEQEALDFLRENLDPTITLGVWTNFEIVEPQGKLYEIDALILTIFGLWMVEIKSYGGQVLARELSIIRSRKGGTPYSESSPLLSTNLKCKVLVSRLSRTHAFRNQATPYLAPLVFLSQPDVRLSIDAPGVKLAFTDRTNVLEWLSKPHPGLRGGMQLSGQEELKIISALKELDIQGSRLRQQKVGDYVLRELLGEGPDYQDHRATHHTLETVQARVRTYSSTLDSMQRERAHRLAGREFQLLHDLKHEAILAPIQLTEHEMGTALIYHYYADAMRLDHFLESQGNELSFLKKLEIWSQVGEALRYAHQRQLLHRSLAPQNVLIQAQGDHLKIRVFNWHTARGMDLSSGTVHLHQVVCEDVTPYIAPELVDYPTLTDFRSDLFSLGCLGYYLFSLKMPATDYDSLMERLLEADFLDLRPVCDEAPEELAVLVQDLTRLEVTERVESAEKFLELLAGVERALLHQSTVAEELVNPFEALAGQMVLPGWEMVQKLGQGASACAFLVRSPDTQELNVLKLALTPDKSALLEQEAEVLVKLKHPQIVELRQEVQAAGRTGLLLSYAGAETLSQRLYRDGSLPLELLQRLGEDLLSLVEVLEDQGVFHRDIKPANLAVKLYGKNEQLRLMMFDFSLSRAPLQETKIGTAMYRDPFLGGRRPYDSAAERYSAGATLHEMATGILPQWGDGLTTPRGPDTVLHLGVERLDPSLRDRFAAFFHKCFQRDASMRFANAHEMKLAWQQLFMGIEPALEQLLLLKDEARHDTLLSELTREPRLLEAFDRLEVTLAGTFLALPIKKPGLLAGFGGQTRRLLQDFQALLQSRYQGAVPKAIQGKTQGLEALLLDLLPSGKAQKQLVETYLGLHNQGTWLSLSQTLKQVKQDNKNVQVLSRQRTHWSNLLCMQELLQQLSDYLDQSGGVLLTEEAQEALLRWRGSLSNVVEERRVLARAILRALIDSEACQTLSRFEFAVLNRQELLIEDGAMKNALETLAERADQAMLEKPLPSQSRLVTDLKNHLPMRTSHGWSEPRMLKLVCAVASHARLSPKLEVYPAQMEVEETLRRSRAFLLMSQKLLTMDDLKSRVKSRYPDSADLPDQPEPIQQHFENLGIPLRWSDSANPGGFEAPHLQVSSVPSSSTVVPALQPLAKVAQQLDFAFRAGEPQVLMCRRSLVFTALQWLHARYGFEVVSLEQALLSQLRLTAQDKNVKWDRVVTADAEGPTGKHWSSLQKLVDLSVEQLAGQLRTGDKPLLMQHLGLLGRYGRFDMVSRLLATSHTPNGRPACWLLVHFREGRPTVDGRALPLPAATLPRILPASLFQLASSDTSAVSTSAIP